MPKVYWTDDNDNANTVVDFDNMKPLLFDFNVDKFSNDIFAYRTSNNLNRNKFASLVGATSGGAIQDIENNKRKPPLIVFFSCCELMNKSVFDYIIK